MIKNLFLTTSILIFWNTNVYSQKSPGENAQMVIELFKECDCQQLSIISGAYIKDYPAQWLKNMRVEDNYLVFEKDGRKHRWLLENVPFIENAPGSLNVYLAVHIR